MQTELTSKRQINHKVMRVIVGVIALLLSPVVWFLSGSESELTSISIFSWADSRDVFVGSLIAVGFFLSVYNGLGHWKRLGILPKQDGLCLCHLRCHFSNSKDSLGQIFQPNGLERSLN